MRIKYFARLILEQSEDFVLQDSEVVIDGQNFFYKLYAFSGLQSMFGCESDKYARYLRSVLSNFKKANVKCYIFFKGGHEDPSRIWVKRHEDKSRQFQVGITPINNVCVKPQIFMKEIYKQVLEEMGFDYVICQYEAKRECIAFAQKRNCPIISNDIEFCFSGVPYIPSYFSEGKFNYCECKLFILDDFMRKFRLNKEKLAIFIVLTDEYLFPENHFQRFMKAMKIRLYAPYNRNRDILKWLSGVNNQVALNLIFKYCSSIDQTTFSEKYREAMAFVSRQEKPGLPSQYLENQLNLQFVANDPQWFEKGVVTNAIAIPYINLYRWNTAAGSWTIPDNGATDPLLFSLDIIKYAFSLLCDFRGKEFNLVQETVAGVMEKLAIQISSNFRKPNYTALESPFENGWGQVRYLGLFEHFLMQTLPMSDFTILGRLPEDARLLCLALVYFARKKPESTINEVCSVFLSYLVLNVLSEVDCKDSMDTRLASHPILVATPEEDSIAYQDKLAARRNLAEYLDVLPEGAEAVIFDRQRIHTLVEFQHCLEQLNFLNHLCGRPYQPTVYSKTFNGTLVHRVLFSLERQAVDTLTFFENKLNEAPTVLVFWNRLISVYNQIN